jgi:hypothetical protein
MFMAVKAKPSPLGRLPFDSLLAYHADRVRAAELRRRARLPLEALDDLRLGEHGGVQHLDRDTLPETHVRRLEDDAHPALAEDLLDAVLAVDERPLHGERGLGVGVHDARIAPRSDGQ